MKRRVAKLLKASPIIGEVISLLKSIRLKKSDISLYKFFEMLFKKLELDDILDRASGVAFSFTTAIFPAIIFIFTLIPFIQGYIQDYVQMPDLDNQIMAFLAEEIPVSMFDTVASTIQDILSIKRGSLLSFGVVFALFMATNGMLALMKTFNRCYKTAENRTYLKTHFIALMLTILLAFVMLFAVISLIIGQYVLELMQEWFLTEDYIVYMIIVLRFVIVFLIFFITISSIYYFAPAVHSRWKFLSPGSIIAAFLCIGVSFAFTSYINNFGTYNKFYGSIGALIALMLWLYMLSVILLLGFEINACLDKAQAMKLEKEKPAL